MIRFLPCHPDAMPIVSTRPGAEWEGIACLLCGECGRDRCDVPLEDIDPDVLRFDAAMRAVIRQLAQE